LTYVKTLFIKIIMVNEADAKVDTPSVDLEFNAVKKQNSEYDPKQGEKLNSSAKGEVSIMFKNGDEIYGKGDYSKFNSGAVKKDVGVGYRTIVDSTKIDVGVSFEVVKDKKEIKAEKKIKQIKIKAGVDLKY